MVGGRGSVYPKGEERTHLAFLYDVGMYRLSFVLLGCASARVPGPGTGALLILCALPTAPTLRLWDAQRWGLVM